jgi:hypothetical protein
LVNKRNDRRKTWQYPWGYRESFMIVLEVFLLGMILQVLSGGRHFNSLHWPFNMITGIILIILLVLTHILFGHKPFIKWLSSVPAAVSTITFFAFVVLLLGFIPQNNPNAPGFIKILGLTYIRNGWLLTVSGFYLLVCLGLVILRRALPLNRRNIGFLFNHAGLWIILFAGSLGNTDVKKLDIELTEGQEYQNTGLNQTGNAVSLPFSLKLLDFTIDEYPPKIGIGNIKTGELMDQSGTQLVLIKEDQVYPFNDWEIKVIKIFTDAYPCNETYEQNDSTGAAPAAFVHVKNSRNNVETEGWISCGSYAIKPSFISLDSDHVLFMNQPEPEKYASEIVLLQDNKTDTVIIEVNKPYHIKGFSLYQLSYDESYGKWSATSLIEAVKDPWLPVVYIGILMMLAGSVYLFWKGNEIRKE